MTINVDHVCDGEPEVSCNKCLLRQSRAEVQRLNLQIDELKTDLSEECGLSQRLAKENLELRALLDKEGMARAGVQGELMAVNRLNQELQVKLGLAYPVVEAARAVYEVQERAMARGREIGAVKAYEEAREAHLAACEAVNQVVAAFNLKATEKRKCEISVCSLHWGRPFCEHVLPCPIDHSACEKCANQPARYTPPPTGGLGD